MPPPATTLETVRQHLRTFLRDFPEENRLVAGEENPDSVLDLGILLAVDDFNFATAPLIGQYRLENFPSLHLLILGAAIQVLRMAGIMSSRNFLNFSAGGVSATISDKTAAYQSWINQLQADYEAKKNGVKMFINLSQAWGGVATPYSGLAYYRGGYSPALQEVFVGFRGFF